MERLQKFIAATGRASRRQAEIMISAGRVRVNGKVVTKLGTTIDPSVDHISVDGRRLELPATLRYIVLNKPRGIVCTRATLPGEKTVYDLIPHSRSLVIAGRLDKESEGLVLLTNDGALVNTLTHPRYEHEKEYEVTTVKPLSTTARQKLETGIQLEEGLAKVDALTVLAPGRYRLVLHQGWNRQIRRMFTSIHTEITQLKRIRLNRIALGSLPSGQWQDVQRDDIVG